MKAREFVDQLLRFDSREEARAFVLSHYSKMWFWKKLRVNSLVGRHLEKMVNQVLQEQSLSEGEVWSKDYARQVSELRQNRVIREFYSLVYQD